MPHLKKRRYSAIHKVGLRDRSAVVNCLISTFDLLRLLFTLPVLFAFCSGHYILRVSYRHPSADGNGTRLPTVVTSTLLAGPSKCTDFSTPCCFTILRTCKSILRMIKTFSYLVSFLRVVYWACRLHGASRSTSLLNFYNCWFPLSSSRVLEYESSQLCQVRNLLVAMSSSEKQQTEGCSQVKLCYIHFDASPLPQERTSMLHGSRIWKWKSSSHGRGIPWGHFLWGGMALQILMWYPFLLPIVGASHCGMQVHYQR